MPTKNKAINKKKLGGSKKKSLDLKIKILVVGIGGGGGSIVSELSQDVKSADFAIINTDFQFLQQFSRKKNLSLLLIGNDVTKGFGTGMDPLKGEKAAIESEKEIKEMLTGYDFIVVVSSLGGGSGSGISPKVIQIAKNLGSITYGVFTYPFDFEGIKRQKISEVAIGKIKKEIDSFSIIQNQKIFEFAEKETGIEEAFSLVNKKLNKALNGLIDAVSESGLINTDWADLQTIFKQEGGLSYLISVDLDTQRLSSLNSSEELNKIILDNSIYSYDIENANGILLNIFTGPDIALSHINKISNAIGSLVSPNAKIIIGINDNKNIKQNMINITLLAVGCRDDVLEGESSFLDKAFYIGDVKKAETTESRAKGEGGSYWDTPTYIRKRK